MTAIRPSTLNTENKRCNATPVLNCNIWDKLEGGFSAESNVKMSPLAFPKTRYQNSRIVGLTRLLILYIKLHNRGLMLKEGCRDG